MTADTTARQGKHTKFRSTMTGKSLISSLLVLLLPVGSLGFVPRHPIDATRSLQLQQQSPPADEIIIRRPSAMVIGGILLSGLLTLTPPVWADEEAAPAPAPPTIEACRKDPSGGVTNCVSTKNVKQLDLYAPPWTFESSAEEAAARLKGVVASDSALDIVKKESEGDGKSLYFEIKSTRSAIFNDNLQFIINPQDKVVTFRAEQDGEPAVSDFGAIRKELESIRTRCKFGVMGQGVSADSMPSQNGPIGQLKAFYGLQSGKGFEDVFGEE
ncbi:expressed unknown protein [Seminavis robusta]|uniref:Uncharacterized protein n=1 Tax=Seminavis robusta TaxID=568900 RepID=A0A9N8HXW9_9STRA|nr:expressed unknown protein [Seminavis robusta]|eukprot:Sro2333_g323690.1 n/a (271) ;mRNA; r:3712-4524